jgi:exonuclease VII small subunit
MLTLLRNFRARLRGIEQSVQRIETTQAEDRRVIQSLQQEIQTLRQVQQVLNDTRDEVNQALSHLRGTADHTQRLSGETLSAVNDFRLQGRVWRT